MGAQLWVGGQRASADRLANMLHKSIDFTPDWNTTSGANFPDYGNAVIDCRYSQSGDLVVAHYDISFGSTTNFGGGGTADNWMFSLPVVARNATIISQNIGDMNFGTTASGARVVARSRLIDTSNVQFEISNGRLDAGAIAVANRGLVDLVSPFTFNSGSFMKGVLEYEAA